MIMTLAKINKTLPGC